MIKHKSVEKVIYLHNISINHANLLIISITANTIRQKTHSSICQAHYKAAGVESDHSAWQETVKKHGPYKAANLKRSGTEKSQRPHEVNCKKPHGKTRSPSLACAMEGLSEEGGDLLSRIAVQYHRRARA